MSDDEFKIDPEKDCRDCALVALANALTQKAPRPFRKRRPVIFWGGVIIIMLCALKGVFSFFDDGESPDGDCLALARVRGAILDPSPTLAWLRELERDPKVKGLLLRVDSPGGGAAASQELYAALARFAAKKPLVASMGSTAASGGLMICMAAGKVYANASTITGSIGVRMDIPQFEGLMAKIGVGQETLVTAPFKDAASWARPLTPADKEYLESVLYNMHDQFVDIVAKGRKMPREEAAKLASGKIFTGQEAIRLGLVDELGGRDEAHVWLAEQTGISPDKKLLTMPAKKLGLVDRLLTTLTNVDPDELFAAKERFTKPAFLFQWGL